LTQNTRRQLTLFVKKQDAIAIESIRSTFNPVQQQLIDCHVTLCREDEIGDLEKVLNNLRANKLNVITIQFGPAIRFDNGKGVLLPAVGDNHLFQQLRLKILEGTASSIRRHEPHITLMHPKNATCTDEVFEIIQQTIHPQVFRFTEVSLIEQINGGVWKIIQTFSLKER
jgi:2'-5' RNA ligase